MLKTLLWIWLEIRKFATTKRKPFPSHRKVFLREFSSVGLEHYLDKVGVAGSSPVIPTIKSLSVFKLEGFLNWRDMLIKVKINELE
jgi:hypothetical protein